MESPEKWNANFNEAPTCCQGGFSKYFWDPRGPCAPGEGVMGTAVYLAQFTQRVASGTAFNLPKAICWPQLPQIP